VPLGTTLQQCALPNMSEVEMDRRRFIWILEGAGVLLLLSMAPLCAITLNGHLHPGANLWVIIGEQEHSLPT
jgi:hypothetical protein